MIDASKFEKLEKEDMESVGGGTNVGDDWSSYTAKCSYFAPREGASPSDGTGGTVCIACAYGGSTCPKPKSTSTLIETHGEKIASTGYGVQGLSTSIIAR